MDINSLLNGFVWYVAFVFSTTLHEASHAFIGFKLGDRTAYEGGQVTLDPIPHMKREPFGMIVVPILSYVLGGWMIGWASAPYNYLWSINHPKSAAKMSLAGPLSNLIIVLIAGVFIRIGLGNETFISPETINFTHLVDASEQDGVMSTITLFINVFFSLNLLLFIFNLLPIPPLDGSGIVPLFISDDKSRQYLQFINNPVFSFAGLFIAWKIFDVIYDSIHLAVVNLLYFGIAHYG
jgi:Zn-dependent protease